MIEIIPIDIYINTVIIASGIDEREFDLFYYDNVLRMTNEEYERIREDIVNPNCCAGRNPTHYGYKWMYLSDYENSCHQ